MVIWEQYKLWETALQDKVNDDITDNAARKFTAIMAPDHDHGTAVTKHHRWATFHGTFPHTSHKARDAQAKRVRKYLRAAGIPDDKIQMGNLDKAHMAAGKLLDRRNTVG